jgi:hypothetical protein
MIYSYFRINIPTNLLWWLTLPSLRTQVVTGTNLELETSILTSLIVFLSNSQSHISDRFLLYPCYYIIRNQPIIRLARHFAQVLIGQHRSHD